MNTFNALSKSVLLAVVCAAVSQATPIAAGAKFSTHGVREVGGGVQVEVFHPESVFLTDHKGPIITHSHSHYKRDNATTSEVAISFLESKLGVKSSDILVKTTTESSAAKHAYVQQKLNGIPVANAVANVALSKANKIVAFGSSFVKPTKVAANKPAVMVEDAIKKAEQALKGKYDPSFPKPSVEYLVKKDGTAALAHVFQVRNDQEGTWYEAFVDAQSGDLLSVTDFRAHATYRVLPISKEYPTEGFETVIDPQDTSASPRGWHNDGMGSTTSTAGNNVVAFKGSESSTTAQSGGNLTFIYNQNPSASPITSDNLNAARVNAFYVANTIHDIAYKYGFTESMFNFQNSNFGKGGQGGDRVKISVQSSAGMNNADFTTPPDGQSGQMRMYLWDQSNPQRDGALENDIVVHEYGHGISNRMTGGGTGRCLQTMEARGMGEGWSDALAEWTEQKSATVKDYVMGQYVLNRQGGLRSRPYSTSVATNPLKYSSIASLNEEHNIGEVWANMLHNVYAGLVQKLGFSPNAKTDPAGKEGNIVFLHLFMDAMALQPCNPTFTDARDAWIQADVNRYNGANKCTIWKAFASRGLGVNARNYRDDFTVPAGC